MLRATLFIPQEHYSNTQLHTFTPGSSPLLPKSNLLATEKLMTFILFLLLQGSEESRYTPAVAFTKTENLQSGR